MRLKGGKVLLDMSALDVTSEPDVAIGKEVYNAILTKGLVVLLKFDGVLISQDIHLSNVDWDNNSVMSQTFTYTDKEQQQYSYAISINEDMAVVVIL